MADRSDQEFELLWKEAEPVLRSRIHTWLARGAGQWTDVPALVEDLLSQTKLKVYRAFRRGCRFSSFTAYATSAAYSAYIDWLAEERPDWWRLRDRVRRQLTVRPEFKISGEGEKCECGLQEVTTSGAPDPEAYKAFIRGEMGPFVARFLPDHEAWRAFGPRGRRLGALVKAVLQWLRQPVLLNDLVSFLELLLPLKPSPPVAVTKGPGGAIEMSDWALEIGRLLLRMKLSRAERGAFLLTRNVQTIKQIGLNFYLVAMMVGYCEGLRQAPGFLAAAWDSLCLAEKQEIAGALRPAIGLPSEARLEDLPVLLLARWDSLTPQQRERARGILARTIQSPRRDLPSGVIPPFLASFPDDPGPVGQGLVQRVMQAFQASQAGPAPGDDSEQPASTPRTLAAFPAIWSRLAQDGLTFQEIGDILGIQATTVASRQSECKKKLRKALEKKWD